MDSVTLRQWSVNGEFPFYLNTEEVQPECLELIGETISNEYYQQLSLKATTPNCRWSYTLNG
jgi:hypothetical protein